MSESKEGASPSPGPTQVEDLTQEVGAVAQAIAPINQSFGSATLADWTRVALAGGLLAILGVLTLGTGWFVVTYPSKEKAIEAFLQVVFAPIVGLVGTVLGFYFGARSASRDSRTL